jgi:hypothetical protein
MRSMAALRSSPAKTRARTSASERDFPLRGEWVEEWMEVSRRRPNVGN